ncbi:hypothetical protein [Thermoactinomyces sp. DSM 45892]|uniref:hypothetical protein n=1 Tax=Thermoactinomyces sp. DSM 45892 TaxID=1882753 RepID=UPI00089D80E5|nr:hypothetical protein [Thermoactinomyces sp. DSM 45892]SDY88009.1 hypothetical protein SAMN05444416_109152 [Thermoactinomyces sp. DSM 45892]
MDKNQVTLETILKSLNDMKTIVEKRFDKLEAKVDKNTEEIKAIREQVIENSEGIADLTLTANKIKDDMEFLKNRHYAKAEELDRKIDQTYWELKSASKQEEAN